MQQGYMTQASDQLSVLTNFGLCLQNTLSWTSLTLLFTVDNLVWLFRLTSFTSTLIRYKRGAWRWYRAGRNVCCCCTFCQPRPSCITAALADLICTRAEFAHVLHLWEHIIWSRDVAPGPSSSYCVSSPFCEGIKKCFSWVLEIFAVA